MKQVVFVDEVDFEIGKTLVCQWQNSFLGSDGILAADEKIDGDSDLFLRYSVAWKVQCRGHQNELFYLGFMSNCKTGSHKAAEA